MFSRREIISAAMSVLAVPAVAGDTWSPGNRTVTLTIPFAPGGGTDAVFRDIRKYGAHRGVNFVADYKSGAEGLLGMRHGAATIPNGYFLTMGSAGTMSHDRDGFNAVESFDHITGIISTKLFLITGNNSGITTIRDLIGRLKNDPRITGGSGSVGHRITMEDFATAAGVRNIQYVNYRGASGVITDVIGGHIHWGMVPGISVAPAVNSGQLRLLGSTRTLDQPMSLPGEASIYEDVPYFEKLDIILVSMPKGADAPIRRYWNDWFRSYLNDQRTQQWIVSEHGTSIPFGPDYIRHQVRAMRERLSRL